MARRTAALEAVSDPIVVGESCTVRASVMQELIAHARLEHPYECCGVLLGQGRTIVEAAPVPNVAESPAHRFTLDPKAHIDIRREGRLRHLAVVGFYHSHPESAAEPSATDIAEAAYPDSLHAIVSLAGRRPTVRLFAWRGGWFEELAIVEDGERPRSSRADQAEW